LAKLYPSPQGTEPRQSCLYQTVMKMFAILLRLFTSLCLFKAFILYEWVGYSILVFVLMPITWF
jgi:hypothetical protein